MDSLFNFDAQPPNEPEKGQERADYKTRFQPGNSGGPGRPAYKISERDYRIIEGLVISGYSNEKIASLMGWSEDTFYVLRQRDARFSELLTMTKEKAEMQVTASLFKRAVGYKYKERKKKEIDKPDGVETHTEVSIKEMPPDVKAAQIWLMNRNPDKWKEKPEAGNTTINNNNVVAHTVDWQEASGCDPLEPFTTEQPPAGEAGTDVV